MEESLLNQVWKHRSLGVDLPFSQTIADDDIVTLCNDTWFFLQAINKKAGPIGDQSLKIVTTKNGCNIHVYSNMAMSVAAPKDSVSGSSRAVQISITEEMARLIIQMGWSEVEIVAGTAKMKTLFWIASKRAGFELVEYVPTEAEKEILNRLSKLLGEDFKLKVPQVKYGGAVK